MTLFNEVADLALVLCFHLMDVYSLVATTRGIPLSRIILETATAIFRKPRSIPLMLFNLEAASHATAAQRLLARFRRRANFGVV